MAFNQIPLKFVAGSKWAYLREFCGSDEQSVAGTGTVEAIRLLDRLLVNVSGTDMGPGMAKVLTASDRDRLLAAIYMRAYGPRIDSVVNCNSCNAPFDVDFSLEDLVSHVDSEATQAEMEIESDGVYKLPNGYRFRLPTGEDECAVLGMTTEDAEKMILERCVVKSDPTQDAEDLQRALSEIAPILSLDMDAQCPECDHQQTVHFDIQHYLLYKLMQEQEQLILETHSLARAYGWGHDEILSLPRKARKRYVELVEAELDSQRRRSPI